MLAWMLRIMFRIVDTCFGHYASQKWERKRSNLLFPLINPYIYVNSQYTYSWVNQQNLSSNNTVFRSSWFLWVPIACIINFYTYEINQIPYFGQIWSQFFTISHLVLINVLIIYPYIYSTWVASLKNSKQVLLNQ